MSSYLRSMAGHLRRFQGYLGARAWWLLPLMSLGGLLECVGFGLFIPFLSSLDLRGGAESPVKVPGAAWLASAGITLTPGLVMLIIVAAFATKALVAMAEKAYAQYLCRRLQDVLRSRVFAALEPADYLFVKGCRSGQVASITNVEIKRAFESCLALLSICSEGVLIAMLFLAAILVDWRLSLLAVALAFGFFVATRGLRDLAGRLSPQISSEYALFQQSVLQLFQHFKYAKATHAYPVLRAPAGEANSRLLDLQFRQGLLNAFAESTVDPLLAIGLLGILAFSIFVFGTQPASAMVTLLFLYRIFSRILVFQNHHIKLYADAGGLTTIASFLDELGRHSGPKGGRPFTRLESGLELRDVSFSYGTTPVLSGVSLDIPRHATVAVVGASGGGKTTLVDLLTGLLRPTGGEVLVDGASLAGLDADSYHRRIGYVCQEGVLFDDTIRNNVTLWDRLLPFDAARYAKALRDAHCADFIAACPAGDATHIGERGVNLSGGQKQRLALARELYKEPELLILDEATSALDSAAEQAIRRSLEAMKGRLAIVIIAHRLSTVLDADMVHVLDAGRLVERGNPRALLARRESVFRRMCAEQGIAPDIDAP